MAPSLPLVLIGPMAAGKTTLARALSVRLGLPYAPLDWVAFSPMVLDGFDVRVYEEAETWADKHALRLPHLLPAVRAVLRDFGEYILDFGAGHAHFDEEEEREELAALLAPLPNVIRVLPAADPDAAVRICVERDQERWRRAGYDWDASRAEWHDRYVRSACFRQVAKRTVITGGRSVADCVEEIVAGLHDA